jgi:hypothetical protein
MSTITVLVPEYEAERPRPVEMARRFNPTEPVTITLIDNAKPNAKALLGYVADGLRDRFEVTDVIVHSKPGASKPIDADEAEMLAARSHLVITGLGD